MPDWTFRQTGDWGKAVSILTTVTPRLQAATAKAILQEMHFLRKKILQQFAQGGPEGGSWHPHSEWTRAIRLLLGNKKSKLLQQSGDLRKSVTVVPIQGGGAFVGILRTAQSSSKLGAVNLAEVHEFGKEFNVTMTPKMRALLFAAAHRAGMEHKPRFGPQRPGGGPTTIHIVIPARPILGPVFDRYAKPADLENSIVARIGKMLGGDMGTAAGSPRE